MALTVLVFLHTFDLSQYRLTILADLVEVEGPVEELLLSLFSQRAILFPQFCLFPHQCADW